MKEVVNLKLCGCITLYKMAEAILSDTADNTTTASDAFVETIFLKWLLDIGQDERNTFHERLLGNHGSDGNGH